MELLVVNQVFDQGPLVDGYISLDITGAMFEKESSLMEMNDQMWWSIAINF